MGCIDILISESVSFELLVYDNDEFIFKLPAKLVNEVRPFDDIY